MVTGRAPMISNNSRKSPRCIGNSLASAARRDFSSSARIISRTAVTRPSSKNMCSVRQARCPRRRSGRRPLRRPAYRHWRARRACALCRPKPISVATRRRVPAPPCPPCRQHWPVEPSTGDLVALFEHLAAGGHGLRIIIDADRAGAGDAGLAHAARDHRRVRGHAAAGGERNAFGGVHAVDIFRRGFDPHRMTCGRRS